MRDVSGAPESNQKKRVLIVEDDEKFRILLGQVLESEGFEVRYAANGLDASSLLAAGIPGIHLVISDIRMPGMDGVALLKDVKTKHPTLPIILMTGFSEVLEAKDAFELGAESFLPKPFKTRDLLESVEGALKPRQNGPDPHSNMVEEDEYSFCKIHVDEFTSTSTLPSDIYIRLMERKFVKVGRCGAHIQVERIQVYKEKKVEYFYVHNQDFAKYAGLALRIAKAAAGSKMISRNQKVRLFKHAGEILLTRMFIEDLKQEDVEFSQVVLNNTLNLIGDQPDLFELIDMLQGHSDETYAHSVAVSVYGALIAKKMGWTSQQNLLKLSLGGLFHDIGKKELPQTLLAKSRREMSPEEISLYESHPQRGKLILESIPNFSSDVVQIAFQHHETNQGTGFPLGLTHSRIHPLAKIIHLANEFFHLCQKYKTLERVPCHSALSELMDSKAGEFEPAALKALLEVFGHPVPEALKKVKAP